MKHLNVAMIGSGFMGKAHALAYANMPVHFYPAPAIPVRKVVVDVSPELAKAAAERLGFEESSTDWREVVNRPDIDIVDICTPNDSHAEIAAEAAWAGKHIICEKPLARNASEAKTMLEAVTAAGVTHAVGFNYRYTPAIRMAKKLLDAGRIGKVLSFRGHYMQDWSADPNTPSSWRFSKATAGSGALGDIGTHVVDTARYLLGDIEAVSSVLATHVTERPASSSAFDQLASGDRSGSGAKVPVDVDDAVYSLLRFSSGAIGTLEATRNARGRHNYLGFEIQGADGTIVFDYERLGELQVMFANDRDDVQGFRTVQAGPFQPYGDKFWPIAGMGTGYLDVKTIECYEFIKAVTEGRQAAPSFEDGYKVELVADAIQTSASTGQWADV
ncbi:Gfo/Idh/MocA family protein [Arthrobacter sp. NPDC056691]|uniref:Gfo/Idh/MocA family protein n=1 Tax=Arthrobacter sp. NPDC056691 TaxID=3345913 RepID=UPI00366ACB5A